MNLWRGQRGRGRRVEHTSGPSLAIASGATLELIDISMEFNTFSMRVWKWAGGAIVVEGRSASRGA